MPDDYSDLLVPPIVRVDTIKYHYFMGDPSDSGAHILIPIVDDPNKFLFNTEPTRIGGESKDET
jgi:hypothetical protein